jgi:HlyD family secretion protein
MLNVAVTSTPNLSRFKQLLQRRWLRIGVPLLMVILGPGGVGVQVMNSEFAKRSPSEFLTQTVERRTVSVTIPGNGTVTAARSVNLSPKNAGVIERLLVEAGDRVRQGQVLAVMDDSNLRGQLLEMQAQLAQQEANLSRLLAGNRPEEIAQAEAQLAEVEANLQQLRSGNRSQEIGQAEARLRQAQATLKFRQTDVQRNQQLFNAGAISRQTLDQSLTDRDVAQAQVAEAQQGLTLQEAGTRPELIRQAEAKVEQQTQTVALLKAGSREEEITQARAQVEAAQGTLQTIQAQLQDTQIVAPFDGIVLQTYADVGSFVSPSVGGGNSELASTSILTLSSQRQRVAVNLSESQLAKIKLGQAVEINADAIPGKTFTGKVAKIAPKATVVQNVTSFEVQVDITSLTGTQLRDGMNVDAQFTVGNVEDALLVPNAAVIREAEGEGVYVLDGDRNPIFQPIQTGVTVGNQTQVKSGLQGNEQVLLSPPTKPKSNSGFGLPKPPTP